MLPGTQVCTDDQPFSTIVGPRDSVLRLVEEFTKTEVAARFELVSPPRHIDLGVLGHEFTDPNSPAVAVLDHSGVSSFAVAGALQAEVLVGDPRHGIDPLPDLRCEPGFLVRAVAAAPGPSVSFKPNGVARLRATMPQVPSQERAKGVRVALLDTGAISTANDMIDFVHSPPTRVTTDDENGHGEAVAQVISSLRPSADIHPLRVLGPIAKDGPSYRIFAGLAYALWTNHFDIVNASLTTASSDRCEHFLGNSIDYIVKMCQQRNPASLPVIVAAAGNDSGQASAYPALLHDAVVSLALEEDPSTSSGYRRASYNSTPPSGSRQWEAFGGTDRDPIGSVSSGGQQSDLFGTSFAAAAVTAAHLP